jgi:hypothetical protein
MVAGAPPAAPGRAVTPRTGPGGAPCLHRSPAWRPRSTPAIKCAAGRARKVVVAPLTQSVCPSRASPPTRPAPGSPGVERRHRPPPCRDRPVRIERRRRRGPGFGLRSGLGVAIRSGAHSTSGLSSTDRWRRDRPERHEKRCRPSAGAAGTGRGGALLGDVDAARSLTGSRHRSRGQPHRGGRVDPATCARTRPHPVSSPVGSARSGGAIGSRAGRGAVSARR